MGLIRAVRKYEEPAGFGQTTGNSSIGLVAGGDFDEQEEANQGRSYEVIRMEIGGAHYLGKGGGWGIRQRHQRTRSQFRHFQGRL